MMENGKVEKQQLTSELETRLAAIEARLEKLDPTPRLEVSQPYPAGSNVYSIADLEAHNPFTVVGYRGDRILVITSPGTEREFPIESVVPLAKCRNAQPSPEQVYGEVYSNMDPAARAYWQGRREAQIDARTKPSGPFVPQQERYS